MGLYEKPESGSRPDELLSMVHRLAEAYERSGALERAMDAYELYLQQLRQKTGQYDRQVVKRLIDLQAKLSDTHSRLAEELVPSLRLQYLFRPLHRALDKKLPLLATQFLDIPIVENSIHCRDGQDRTVLARAAELRHPQLLTALLRRNACPLHGIKLPELLDLAVELKSLVMLRAVMRRDTDIPPTFLLRALRRMDWVSESTPMAVLLIEALKQTSAWSRKEVEGGDSILDSASMAHMLEVIMELLQVVDVRKNETALVAAISSSTIEEDVINNTVRLLLQQHGADPGGSIAPLLWAIRHGRYSTMELLMSYRLNLNRLYTWEKEGDDSSSGPLLDRICALHQAVLCNDERAVSILVCQSDIDLNIPTADGLTALQIASESGYTAIVRLLLDTGARTDMGIHLPDSRNSKDPEIIRLVGEAARKETRHAQVFVHPGNFDLNYSPVADSDDTYLRDFNEYVDSQAFIDSYLMDFNSGAGPA